MSIPMNRATKEDVMRFARAVWPSAPNLALASFDEKKALNDAADRIAELEKALRGVLGYFRSGNDVPVERATIKADSPEIVFAKSVL